MPENQSGGYNPFNIAQPGGAGFTLLPTSRGDCYYSGYGSGMVTMIFPDGTEYKQDAAALRQYILDLEANRKLQDLSNVNFTRDVLPGDVMWYNHTTGFWELTNYISPGEF
jgi:hypothetical protein